MDQQSGNRLSGVTFEIYKDTELFDTKTTNDNGEILLYDLEPGTYLGPRQGHAGIPILFHNGQADVTNILEGDGHIPGAVPLPSPAPATAMARSSGRTFPRTRPTP